jgi:anti-sigma factor RsiW
MMHEVIQNGLEDYLGGTVRRDFQAHLDQCGECRVEVSEFVAISSIFTVFKEDVPVAEEAAGQPAPGFYYRLSQNLEAQKSISPWSIFSIDAVFGRRVAFASLMTLAVLGGLLVSRESDFRANELVQPEAIMAHTNTVPHDAATDRDRMMLTLATYPR